MPKVRTLKTKKAPEGFEDILPVLDEFAKQMKDAENSPMDAQRKIENYWKITQINHQRSRYIYNLFYAKKEISRDLYNFLLEERYADDKLIAKWKKEGYEKLCCLSCIVKRDSNYKTTCICRVPRADLDEGKLIMCKNCGCRGCASSD